MSHQTRGKGGAGAASPERKRALPTPRLSPRVALAGTVVILVIVNVVDVRVPHAALVAGPVCAAVLLGLARRAGLSWAELGLGPGTWRRGVTWAAAVIGIVALVLAAGAALPLTRAAFRDSRYHLGWAGALLTAFVLIPLGTVLFTAASGVVFCELRRRSGSLLAPAGLHWAVNGLSVLASAAVWAWATTR